MGVFWGIVITLLALLAWGGQVVAWLAPTTAVKLALMESEEDVEPAFWADVRGEAVWDALTLWPMAVAGVLLVVDSSAWVYFGLVGGGIYVYFAGRGIFTRMAILRRGMRIGAPRSVNQAMVFLAVWGVIGAVTIVAAILSLTRS